VCLGFGKLEGKKKHLKSNFSSLFGLTKVKSEKIEGKNSRKICVVIKKNFSFQV